MKKQTLITGSPGLRPYGYIAYVGIVVKQAGQGAAAAVDDWQ